MSHLYKRTKKTCLKFFRKLSSSKQMYIKKLEEEEVSTNNAIASANPNENRPTSVTSQKSSKEQNQEHKSGGSLESINQSLPELTQSKKHKHAVEHYKFEIDEANELENLDFGDRRPHSGTMLQSLTSKLFLTADGYEFRRLQQLRSDTASEVVQFESDNASIDSTDDDIVFEKVKYKQHVRYFRHTPSSSSLENYPPSNTVAVSECSTLRTYNNNYNNNHRTIHMHLQNNHNLSQQNPYLPINVSLGSKLSGNYQSVFISEKRDCYNKLTPVVRWDINGNSLDEDDIFINDNWDDFETKLSQTQDKRLMAFSRSDDSQKSSHRSSSTTLETWLDDDHWEGGGPFNERHDLHCNFCLMKA